MISCRKPWFPPNFKMAPVLLSHVVRFSSQDPVFKAENLCTGKAAISGAWKCAQEDIISGRIEAEFQLERASYFSHIDIGNCGSAFIEILVGNSMWPRDKAYLTLMPSAMLMSPVDCKNWTKTHTVRMFFQNAFSKKALESQWDRIRIICCQPYRKDKQFGLSFIRLQSASEESVSHSVVDGATAGIPVMRDVNAENDSDGVNKLKKASGLMGCLRTLDKSKSPVAPLNRAGKILQAALGSRSPSTPRSRPRNESSSPLSSPESPHRKRNSLSLDEGSAEKARKSPKWSLAGDIHDEMVLFLEEIDFGKLDLEQVTFKDLRIQMENQRGCALTKQEKKVFLEMVKAAIQESLGRNENSVAESGVGNAEDIYSSNSKPKEEKAKKKLSPSFNAQNSSKPDGHPRSRTQSATSTHTSVSSVSRRNVPSDDDLDGLPSVLCSPKKKPTMQKTGKSSSENEQGDKPHLLQDESRSTPTCLVECPICLMFFPILEVEFHAASCQGPPSPIMPSSPDTVQCVTCPVCLQLFLSTDIEQHADRCAESSISKDDRNFGREIPSN